MSGSLLFTSQKNYLKRDTSTGSASIAAPSVLAAYGLYSNSTTITHNLGYVPELRVYFETSASDGKVYPAGGRRLTGDYPGQAANGIICLFEVTTTTLTIYLESNTAKTGNRTVYYVIYKDRPV